jgi:hypothetical protein
MRCHASQLRMRTYVCQPWVPPPAGRKVMQAIAVLHVGLKLQGKVLSHAQRNCQTES